MRYIYEISDGNNLVSIAQQNFNSFREFKELFDEIIKDPRYKPTYNLLIDLRGIKYTPVIGEMEEISEYMIYSKKHLEGTTAIITCDSVHHYLIKFAAILASKEGFKSRIFCNPEYALNWLKDINSRRKLKSKS